MSESGHLELIPAKAQGGRRLSIDMAPDQSNLASSSTLQVSAAELARDLAWVPGQRESTVLGDRCQKLSLGFGRWLTNLRSAPGTHADAYKDKAVPDEVRALRESAFLLEAEMSEVCATFKQATEVPQVRTRNGTVVPRIAAIADDLLVTTAYRFSEAAFAGYVQAFQEVAALQMAELWA